MSLKLDVGDMVPFGVKRKLFNNFIALVNEGDVDNILLGHQSSSLINSIKLSLADKFHRFDLMIALLSHGDASTLSEVLSKRWLYADEKDTLADTHFLLNDLFPNVSYICRQKVLHKIGRFVQSETKIDAIWSAVERKLGFDVALPLLQGCSKAVITSMLANRRVNLSGYQMVQLLKRHPDVGLQYLKENSVKCSKMNPQCSPLHYLYTHRPDDFLDLFVNHPNKIQNFKIGRRRTTKMIRENRDALLQNPKKTAELLKRDRIKRIFSGGEFKKIFESTLPTDPNKVDVDEFWQWVRTVQSHRRIEMVNQAYRNVYDIDFDEHPDHMTAEYIVLLPVEKRLSVIKWKTDNLKKGEYSSWSFKDISHCNYNCKNKNVKQLFLPLKPISHSVPELKKLLLTKRNVDQRPRFIQLLIETCYINDDLPELLNVLKFLSQRKRNEQRDTLYTIYETLAEVVKGMEFSKEIWDIVYEMIQTSVSFGDEHIFFPDPLIPKYIQFRLESKLRVDELVRLQLKTKLRSCVFLVELAHTQNLVDKRILLESYVKELENLRLQASTEPATIYDDETQILECIADIFVEHIHNFNKSVEGSEIEPISLASHPWLISNLEKSAQQTETLLHDKLREAYPVRPRHRHQNCRNVFSKWPQANKYIKIIQRLRQVENLNLNAFHDSNYFFTKMWLWVPNHATILHYLKRNPSDLIDNWSASLSRMLEGKACIALMKLLKQWNYSFFVDETIRKCTEVISTPIDDNGDKEVQIQRKCNAALVLSVLKEPMDWLALVTEHYPRETKVNVAAHKSSEDYRMMATMAKSLMNITESHLTFDALRKFCAGDYLKLTVDSLYSRMYRLLSSKSMHFLGEQLTNGPVSLHKHIIRLYCTMGSLDEKCDALQRIKSYNVTIRYVIYLEANKLFRFNPSEETWTMLSAIIDSTSKDDASILDFLHATPDLDTCPTPFISQYVELLLRKCDPEKIGKLMTHFEKAVTNIPEHTLDKIVMDHSGAQETFNSSFCLAYLRSSISETVLEHRLSNVWTILIDIIQTGWDKKSESTYPARKTVFYFIKHLSAFIEHHEQGWREGLIYRTLLQKFESMATTKFLLQILSLEIGILHIDTVQYTDTERLRQFGSRYARLIDSLMDKYGRDAILMAMNGLVFFVNHFFSKKNSEDQSVLVELVDAMLETSDTQSNQIIAMKLLKDVSEEDLDEDVIKMLDKINAIFFDSSDVIVQTYSAVLHNK